MHKIAVIISMIDESCQESIWDGINVTAQKNGVSLVTFPAASEEDVTESNSHYNIIKHFISEQNFDGIIFFAGAMEEYTEWSVVKEYANSFNIPLVSVAGNVGREGSIQINNQIGIAEIVDHLVTVHNKEHIAFVKGPNSNEEAAERFTAYKNALEDARQKYGAQILDSP